MRSNSSGALSGTVAWAHATSVVKLGLGSGHTEDFKTSICGLSGLVLDVKAVVLKIGSKNPTVRGFQEWFPWGKPQQLTFS